jgi:cytochrome c oxidase cbb3-type subunit 3
MKFINYLESISGVEIYPMTSLLIFFVFFVFLGIRVFRMDKKTIEEINRLPLHDEAVQNHMN